MSIDKALNSYGHSRKDIMERRNGKASRFMERVGIGDDIIV